VKLYPPMGFAPFGNTHVDPKPWRSASWLPPIVKENGFGERLDGALRDLYEWCVTEDVPVMAHTNASNGPNRDFEALAGPKYWAMALDAFPRLRASFGHFGAVVSRADNQPNAEAFLALMRPTPIAPGSRAFADSAYFSEALDDPKALEDALVALFELDARNQKTLISRFMFGTDWMMLVLENDAARYMSDMDTIMSKVSARLAGIGDYTHLQERFSGRNAIEFLGLHKGEKTLQRLEEFYRTYGVMQPEWSVKADA